MRLASTVIVVLATGAFTLARARHDPGGSFAGTSSSGALAELGGGWSLLAAGLAVGVRRRPTVTWLFAAASLLWFAREWSSPTIGSAAAFAAGNVLFLAPVPFVAHAVLALPGGRVRERGEAVALVAGYISAVVIAGLLPTLVFDPPAAGCPDCPRNLLLVHGDPHLYTSLNKWALRLGLIWTAGLGAVVARRLLRLRRNEVVAVLTLAAYLASIAWELAHGLSIGVLGNEARAISIWRLEALLLLAIFGGVLWGLSAERRAREEVAMLVLELADAPQPGGVRRVLREELGDPSLDLAYSRRGSSVQVDAAGVPVTVAPAAGQVITPVHSADGDVGVLVHDARLLERPGVVREAVAAAQLALANEQLQAEVRAQLADLIASRARIVAAADAERQRLERDLHDGAQQRLVGLLLALQLLRTEAGDGDAATATAAAAVRLCVEEALDALREVAHGLYPAVLADAGLGAALEMLAETSHGRVRVAAAVDGRFPQAIENAAYFAAAEATAAAAHATVSANLEDEHLHLEVRRSDSAALAFETVQEIADRVGAVGGRIVADGSIVRAEIPCVS